MSQTTVTTVQVGQVWQDWDVRYRNNACRRLVRVLAVDDTHADVENMRTKKRSRIALKRFKPNATGYLFVRQE